ncbi:MAG: DUF1553 domain-containing protein, partial [Planctomycetaceae bacterium]|nr:DUF1553 domain-containing protein [Planctomycetaceae bacterium]
LRGDEKNIDKSQVIQPGLPAILTSAPLHIEPVELPPVAVNPALQEFVLEDSLEDAQQAIAKAREAVVRAQKQLATLQQLKTTPANAGADEESDDFIVDDFDSIREDDWQLGAGSWSVAGGKLIQTQTGASRAFLRTRHHHPADFIASIRFTTTGGDKWKSVGLAFDVTGTTPGGTTENANEKMIYLSAVEGGSKLQVSYKKDGQQVYPPKAAKALPVSLNTPYEMTIAIRGGLVNVLLNGEHRIAYQLPVPREDGVMDLVAFDAAVAFDSISVRRLPMDYSLIPASNDAQPDLPLTIEAAEKSLQVARLSLAAAELRPDAVRTAFDADRAKSGLPPAASMDVEESKAAIARAAVAARRYELAQAELSMAQAEQKPDDSKAMTAARDHLARARKAVDEPGEDYTSLTASKKALEGPDEKEESRRQPYPSTSTGRRTALARWMIDRRNPLTARVAVNHIWLRHFGQPLVETETDFGLRARQPVQHELLDWLAAELMENHWSMKHIHRLIVTSRTWQLSTSTLGSDDATMSTDRENAYYWRRNPVRMESQVIRDSLLQLAGALDLTMGGPSLDANSKSNVYRRSLYFKHSRDDQNEFLAMFDDADILRCYRRSESVVPQQALALANSELSLRMARTIAANMARDGQIETDEEFVRAVFRRILCREPSEEEQAACIEAMSETRGILTGIAADQTTQRVRENLTHAMINHNDFITIR